MSLSKDKISGVNSTDEKCGVSRRTMTSKEERRFESPVSVSTLVQTNRVYHKGSYLQVGDIVSIVNVDKKVFYAQIRGLLQDQYGNKSAVITWLLPTRNSPKDRFDPKTYILGPEEDIPRKLDYLEFVCHSPSEYFQAKSSLLLPPSKPEIAYVSTGKDAKIVQLPQVKPIILPSKSATAASKSLLFGKSSPSPFLKTKVVKVCPYPPVSALSASAKSAAASSASAAGLFSLSQEPSSRSSARFSAFARAKKEDACLADHTYQASIKEDIDAILNWQGQKPGQSSPSVGTLGLPSTSKNSPPATGSFSKESTSDIE